MHAVSAWSRPAHTGRHPIVRHALVPVRIDVTADLIAERADRCREPGACVIHGALRRALAPLDAAVFMTQARLRRPGRNRTTFSLALPPEVTLFQRRLEARLLVREGRVVPLRDRVLLIGSPTPFSFAVWVPAWAVRSGAVQLAS